jgi:ribosomal protein S18 acetylase RimI-like enzyme
MIRRVTPADIPRVLDLLKRGLDERGIEWDEKILLNKIVTNYHLVPSYVCVFDGKIEGFMGLSASTCGYSGKPLITEYMFYVKPQHRSMTVLSDLVREAQKFADEQDLTLRFDLFVDGDISIKERLFKMHNMKTISIAGVYDG